MTTTIDDLVPDQLWRSIQPLLPTPPPRYGGRPRVEDRACLAGIVYQLRTGIPWRLLPTRQFGCGSPVTCWRRLRDWQRAGVWQRLYRLLLDERDRNSQRDRWPARPPIWRSGAGRTGSSRAVRGAVTSAWRQGGHWSA